MRLSREGDHDLLARTRSFALRIIRLYTALPPRLEAQVIGKQLLRSGTSVGAQLAEAAHGKSRPDFINKVEGCLQELQESQYWMDLAVDAGLVRPGKMQALRKESEELKAIFITIVHRSRRTPPTRSRTLKTTAA